jgi:hypothetical protein
MQPRSALSTTGRQEAEPRERRLRRVCNALADPYPQSFDFDPISCGTISFTRSVPIA